MLLSLERDYQYRSLTHRSGWDNTKTALKASCDGPVGVGEHIRGRTGKHGNTGEPNVSTRRNAAYGQPRDQMTRLIRELVALDVAIRTSNKRGGICTEGNRREREGEGRRQS